MEFAVIQTGGKQYKVATGETLVIEKLPGEPKVGDKIEVTVEKVEPEARRMRLGIMLTEVPVGYK